MLKTRGYIIHMPPFSLLGLTAPEIAMSSFEKDHHVFMYALLMWANHIETGSVSMSAVDMRNCGKEKELNHLDAAQVLFVERLRKLSSAQATNSYASGAGSIKAESGISLNGVWTIEPTGHVCRVGKVKVAQVDCVDVQGSDKAFKATGFMPNIPTDLRGHPTLADAKSYADRAVRAWISALVEVPA